MSKSLNQAFIKAYSKEKARLLAQTAVASPSVDQRPVTSPKLYGNDELIVRFDTATCGSIPVPHLKPVNKQAVNKPKVAVVSPHSRTTARPTRAQAVHMPIPQTPVLQVTGELDTDSRVESDVRSAIAAQMSQAGDWGGSSLMTFLGGLPMLTSDQSQRITPTDRRVASLPPQQSVNCNGYEERSTRRGASSHIAAPPPAKSNEREERIVRGGATSQIKPEPSVNSDEYEERSTRRGASSHIAAPPPAKSNEREERIVRGGATSQIKPEPSVNSDEYEEWSTRRGASSHIEATDNNREDLTRRAVVSNNRDSMREQRTNSKKMKELDAPQLKSPALLPQDNHGPGEFFRLDRPSYVPAAVPQADNPFNDSGELSSEILGESSSRLDLEPSSPAPTVPLARESSQAERAEQVQSVERELRRSKLRIFNPVWEVDSFQWPEVCLELLEQRADSLDAVARNLNDAVQEGLQVLAITSPQGGEGRTTVACCLAKLAGSRGLNVAIVDGDIENPTLSYQTNLDVEQDWKTAILNQLPLEEIAVHSIDDQVTLVPLNGPIDQSEMAASDNRIEFMLHELSASFDLVIVDMGHMSSPRSLVNSLGSRGVISAVVAVVDHRCADAQQIDHCLRRIRQSGVASIGVVENFAA